VQLLNGLGVVAQILLTANQDNGEALAEVENLGNPLKRPRQRQHGSGNEEAGRLMLLERYSKFRALTFSWTLSSESGESTAKQIRITWESGYDKGRRRS
jgi:hypothetical protein